MIYRSTGVGLMALVIVLSTFAVAPVAPAGASPSELNSLGDPTEAADNRSDVNQTRDLPAISSRELARMRADDSRMTPAAIDTTERVVIELPSNRTANGTDLARYGVTVEVRHDHLVQATVPVGNRSVIDRLPWVQQVREPRMAHAQAVSEGVSAIEADDVHADGITGSNVSVGVIDVGFDPSNSEIADNVVATRSFTGDLSNGGDSRHGTAVSEIIVDTAPDAELYLTNVNTGVEFAAAIDWLIEQDVDVISVSLEWRAQPYDGTGFVSQQATKAADAGIVYVNAAGNSAQRHWEGRSTDPDSDRWVNIDGSIEANYLNEGEPFTGAIDVTLSWDDWASPSEDYDLYLFRHNDSGADDLMAWSLRNQSGNGVAPYERIHGTITTEARYYLAIREHDAAGDERLELFTSNFNLEVKNASSSIAAPAAARNITAVAAFRYSTGGIESFSSHGPTNDGRRGVDIAGPDAVTTTAYSGSFFGTSAAAPHLSGVAALLLQKNPMLTNDQVASLLESTAMDMQASGPDYVSGHGRVDAVAAVGRAAADISATGFSISATEVEVGEPIEIGATVTNQGSLTGTATVDLIINGSTAQNTDVTLAPGESNTVTFEHSFDSAGNYAVSVDDLAPITVDVMPSPPNVSVTDYQPSMKTVAVDEPLTVDATVQNTGGQDGEANVTLYTDGVAANTTTVVVEADAKKTVTFTTAFETAGIHTIAIGDDDGTLPTTSITVEEESGPPPEVESDALELHISGQSVRPGLNTTITFNVTNTADGSLAGVAVDITDRPAAWSIVDRTNDDGVWGSSEEAWLWLSVPVGESRTPSLTLSIPRDADLGNYTITANATDSSGHLERVSVTIEVTNESESSIKEVIAGDDGIIGIGDIRRAIQYWSTGEPVPGTGGQTIGIVEIQELIQLWAGGDGVE